MNNVVCVAVGDCREHLLHDMSCVLLAEIRPLGNLVKQLTSADDLSDDIVSFFVLVCLEQFHHVGVIHGPEDIDLLMQPFLLLGLNRLLHYNFDCSLCLLTNMDTFSDLSESTGPEDITNFVICLYVRSIIQVVKNKVLFLKDHTSHFVGYIGSTD